MGGGPFLRLLQRQLGPSVGFAFAWKQYFAQQVWFLAAFCIFWLCIGGSPTEGPAQRGLFECCKIVVVAWGFFVAVHWHRRRGPDGCSGFAASPPQVASLPAQRGNIANAQSGGEGQDVRQACCSRHGEQAKGSVLKLVCIGVPILLLFTFAVNLTLLGVTQLVVYEIYVWGDCAHLGCSDPQVKHGFVGWLAEVGSDVLLAIIFELYFALAKEVAERLASLRHSRDSLHFGLSVEMLVMVLAAVERIETFGVFAFVFVPQWEPPSGSEVDMKRFCGDLFLGTGSIFCLQRRLPLHVRRDVFQKMMKGPFCVAPFVSVLMKVIVPLVAQKLDVFARTTNPSCTGYCRMCGDFIARLLGVIFSHDCDSVGCLRYVFKGWPFGDFENVLGPGGVPEVQQRELAPWEELELAARDAVGRARSAASAARDATASATRDAAAGAAGRVRLVAMRLRGTSPTSTQVFVMEKHTEPSPSPLPEQLDVTGQELSRRDLLHGALREGLRKLFEPEGELMEVNMSFLWLLFFTPILPVGALPTLAVQVLEMKTDLVKLLYVRRRPFPLDDALLISTQVAFTRAAAVAAAGWSLGLSLMTYNDDLWSWPLPVRCGLAVGMSLWLMSAAALALAHADRAWLAVVAGIAVALGSIFIALQATAPTFSAAEH